MSDTPNLPLDTTGCIADTCYMTNEEAGAHFRLLMFAWRSPGRRLPDDDGKLATMLGVTPRKWARLKPIVMCFWHLSEGAWTHHRLDGLRPRVRGTRQSSQRVAKPRSIMAPANANHPRPQAVQPVPDTVAPTRPGGFVR